MIDTNTKNEIKEFLKKDLRLYSYEANLEDKLENGELTKELYEHLLGFLIEYCISSYERISGDNKDNSYNRDEFKSLFKDIQKGYDSIPKWSDFSIHNSFYEPGKYQEIEQNNLIEYIKTGLQINKKLDCIENIVAVRRRAFLVVNCIENIRKEYVDKETLIALKEIQSSLQKALQESRTPCNVIDEKISQYNNHANKIWNNYLNKKGHYLVHNCSKGEFDLNDLDRTRLMSASLITEKTVGLFKSFENNYFGFILRPNQIFAAMEKDIWSHNNPNEFNGEMFLGGINRSIVKLPWQIEQEIISKTVDLNGEPLKYENTNGKNYFENTIYSEILLQGYDISKIFYVSYGENSLSLNYAPAKRMADSIDVPLLEIDLSSLREKQGLKPMSEGMKQRFLRNFILQIYLTEQEIREYFKQSYYAFSMGVQNYEDQFISEKAEQFYIEYTKHAPLTSLEEITEILKEIATLEELQQFEVYYQEYKKSHQL